MSTRSKVRRLAVSRKAIGPGVDWPEMAAMVHAARRLANLAARLDGICTACQAETDNAMRRHLRSIVLGFGVAIAEHTDLILAQIASLREADTRS